MPLHLDNSLPANHPEPTCFQLVGPEKEQYLRERSSPVEGYSSLGTRVAFFTVPTSLSSKRTAPGARPERPLLTRWPGFPAGRNHGTRVLPRCWRYAACLGILPVSARHESRRSEPAQNSPVSGLVLLRPPYCPVLAWSPPSHEDLHIQPWWPGAALAPRLPPSPL